MKKQDPRGFKKNYKYRRHHRNKNTFVKPKNTFKISYG